MSCRCLLQEASTISTWKPGSTTGDPVIDTAIARFIYNPDTLPCDEKTFTTLYWQTVGLDGVPEGRLPEPWADHRTKGQRGESERAFTRADIMGCRNKEDQ